MRFLILTFTCLVLIAPLQAAENQIEQRLQTQQDRLTNIEEQASIKRQQIEDWYSRQLIEIRQLAERQAKKFKLDDRALWTEYAMNEERVPRFDSYFNESTTKFSRDAKSYKLYIALADSYFLGTTADLLMDKNFRQLLINLSNGSAYNPQNLLIRSRARKLLYFADEFESKLSNLQDRKAAKLAATEKWRQDLRANVLRVMNEIKTEPEKVSPGVVSAVCYNGDNSICMISGFDRILRTGDSIGNIEIVKISPEQVEFASGSQKWTQEVGKPANPAWR